VILLAGILEVKGGCFVRRAVRTGEQDNRGPG